MPIKFHLIVHPLSNGHAKEWPLDCFIALIQALPREKFHISVTGLAQENERLAPLFIACPDVDNIVGKLSLEQFIDFIENADGLIANSTGPLHLAAMLGIHALGLFPTGQVISPSRWAPLGKKAEVLCAENNMRDISVASVHDKIIEWL
jgi:ADP-heptose:LPS heptosyltransferase